LYDDDTYDNVEHDEHDVDDIDDDAAVEAAAQAAVDDAAKSV
jgi:hypothetical protein